MENIKWIFFDIGSTLIDEQECYNVRIKETLSGSNDITPEFFEKKMIYYAKMNKNAYKETIKELNLNKTRWPAEKEKLYPNIKNVLYKLSQKYSLGIIANQDIGLADRLENWGILNFFNVIICSEEVGLKKPDKEIFYLALDKAKCNPQNAVMVGDRIDNDIQPAKNIGMTTIWVKQGYAGLVELRNIKEIADFTIQKIDDITSIL